MNRNPATRTNGIALTLLFLFGTAMLAQAQDWTVLLPNGAPAQLTRFYHSSVYDPGTTEVIAFGGALDGSVYNDVEVLTNANGLGGKPTWETLIPQGASGSPPSRGAHSAVYDAVNNRMIVFGGLDANANNLNDVWVLTSANGVGTPTWIQLSPTGEAPPARFAHTAVYDQENNRMIIFAGTGPGISTFSDVWVLSDANGLGNPAWTQLFPKGGPPSGQADHSAIYDPATNVMTVFGGRENGVYNGTNEVWTLSNANGIGSTPVWQKLLVAGSSAPSPRAGHRAFYDPASNRMTVFGGSPLNYPEVTAYNDVWVLLNANGKLAASWKKLNPNFTPPARALPGPRAEHTVVYDSANNRMVVFGGGNAEATYNSVWVLTDANGQ
jgi:hypothetical protein